ncbi:NAC domain-containing protein 83-like [Phoenix dactylifera]|uniref:NAC domain-containing protein 83-like n=1 Tax=Phoenix dactylifera TaxID=42345 RepID=A0A8B9AQQ9_PHODC|nr:NAC domain-containing protein 83-like [Phoenix dactylifera]
MGEKEKFPRGYRFLPTMEELIEYLKEKDSGKPLPTNIIKEVELYNHQPAVLHKRFPNTRIKSRYFFTKLDKRSKNKKHRDRRVKNGGHWICSAGDKPVLTDGGQYTGGVYKTLTYYEGNGRSKKTGWIMKEYRLSEESKQHRPTANQGSDWVLCEIHHKGNTAEDDEASDDSSEEDNEAEQEEPGNAAGLLPDFTHLQHDTVTDIPGFSRVAALLSSGGTGVDRSLLLFGDSHIVPGTGIEDSPPEQPPAPFSCDWITKNPEELESFCNLIEQDFPNLEEDTAWLPLPIQAAPPSNAQLGEQGVNWFC